MRHPDFEKIRQQFIKRYGWIRGEKYYHAWLHRLGLDEAKPYGAQIKEAFKWAKHQGDEYYYCEAAFPVESMNKNIYTEEELIRAARTLIGKPVNLNHEIPLEGVEIIDAEYEGGAVECILRITSEEIRRMIDDGEIIHVSIEAGFRDAEPRDGIQPKGLHFTGLALLTKKALPGIPLTRIYHSTERIIESFEKIILKEVEDEMGEINWEEMCYLCNTPLTDMIYLGGFQVHPQCAQRFWSMATKIFRLSERAVSPHDGPKAPEDREWDADAAEQRIRKWASSDGSGDKDKIDWSKYQQAFAWYNDKDPENFESYKLPHHDVMDGRLCVIWRGVVAALQALHGARGGLDIPQEDRMAVYIHLANHYRQFGREPTPFESIAEAYAHMLEQRVNEQKKMIQSLIAEKKNLEERIRATKRQVRMILKL